MEKATYSARGNESLVDKCIDFKRRGEMSIKILTESLERLKREKKQESESLKDPYQMIGPFVKK